MSFSGIPLLAAYSTPDQQFSGGATFVSNFPPKETGMSSGSKTSNKLFLSTCVNSALYLGEMVRMSEMNGHKYHGASYTIHR